MSRSHLRFLVASMLVVLAFVIAACGGDDNSSSSTGSTSGAAADANNGKTADAAAKKGGKVTMLAASDVDYVDPGHTYYTFGEMVTLATNRPLYSFKPDDANKPVPDLADGEPQISADKETVTVKIKPGVKYAPPVNRAVKSADVKYAFERFFSVNVGGQYATLLQHDQGRAAEADDGRQADLRHRDAGRPDDRVPPHQADGRAVRRPRWSCRSRCRCRRSTPRSSTPRTRRRTTRTSRSPART